MSQQDFLRQFTFGGLLSTALGNPTNRHFVNVSDVTTMKIPSDTDFYFGPAMCKVAGAEKKDVLGTKVLWVDADDPKQPQCTLPPSMMVFSGHGWHLYWILETPILDIEVIEGLNKLLTEDVPTADKACWNVNRVLRVPSTSNRKDPAAIVAVDLRLFRPSLIYKAEDFRILDKLSKADKHKITTGDSRGYRSRSERDWAIITALVIAGASDALIQTIFDYQPCGDKHKENEHYLPHTVETIRAKDPQPTSVGEEIIIRDDGYYIPFRRGVRRISTFLFDPVVLLDGSEYGSQDALVGDVTSDGYQWKDVTFTRGAFTSVNKFDREAPIIAWQFLGQDSDIRKLLPFLLEQLKQKGLPRVAATNVLGLHKINDKWLFLGHNQVLGENQLWTRYSGPLCWLPSQREHPELDLLPDVTDEQIDFIGRKLPLLNEPGTIWPMIGWYAAACLKPWLELNNYRYPVLNVSGTKGSGKTTLIQRVFLPLLGHLNPKTYDSGTTRFVILSLLGAANAVPIAFSEFRYGLVEQFIRFILLAYDTGHDPRGKGDQTTVDYPLTAPFSVDGEDLIEDPAARERVVVAQLHPKTVEEGSQSYMVFQELRAGLPKNFGGYMIREVLKLQSEWKDLLEQARDAVFIAFPGKLPDRVRNNHIVTYLGMNLFCRATGAILPNATVLEKSITAVFDMKAGRAKTLADSMVEDVVNAVVQGFANFNYVYDTKEGVLWFQLAPAHTWWITSRRRQGRGSLERDAIRAQLKEAPYSRPPQTQNAAWMYGVALEEAVNIGLDIPARLSDTQFVVRLS